VTRDFISSEYVISCNLLIYQLSQPILVLNMDGTLNQVGGISGVVSKLVDYKGHSECIQLAVMWLSKQHVSQLLLVPETQPGDQLGDQGSLCDTLPDRLPHLP
jgi:hypothetical protein